MRSRPGILLLCGLAWYGISNPGVVFSESADPTHTALKPGQKLKARSGLNLPVTPQTPLEVGGILTRRESTENARYAITFVYGDSIWARRLSRKSTYLVDRPLRFYRWELNRTWSYSPPAGSVKESGNSAGVLKDMSGHGDEARFIESTINDKKILDQAVAMVYVGNTLYVAGYQSNTVVAIDMDSGQLDPAKFKDGVFRDDANLQGPLAMTRVGEDLLVAGGQSNTLIGIDLASGVLDSGKLRKGLFRDDTILQRPTSVVHIGDTIYVTGAQSNTIAAIDWNTGELDRRKFTNGVYADPANLQKPVAMVHIGNTIYVIGAQSGTVIAVDAATGQLDRSRLDNGVLKNPALVDQAEKFLTIGDLLMVVDANNNVLIGIDPIAGKIVPTAASSEPGATAASRDLRPTSKPGLLILSLDQAFQKYPELMKSKIPALIRYVGIVESVESILNRPGNKGPGGPDLQLSGAEVELLRSTLEKWLEVPVITVSGVARLQDGKSAIFFY